MSALVSMADESCVTVAASDGVNLSVRNRPGHRSAQPLRPGGACELAIALTRMARLSSRYSRVLLEFGCADAAVAEAVFADVFSPDKIGIDCDHLGSAAPSSLMLRTLGDAR